MAKITASIVSYGGWEEIVTGVNSILAHAPEDFKLYIIDNKSPDDTLAQLKAQPWDARVEIIPLEKNEGFGGGHDAVLGRLDSEYHFVINPDVQVDSPVLSQLPEWMAEHPDVVMATPQLYFPDGRVQHLPRRKPNFMALVSRQVLAKSPFMQPFYRINLHYTMEDTDLSGVTDIQFCTGSFFCIRTDTYKKIGGFDRDYFMYVEDADITQKALGQGRVCLVPQFRAVHAWHRNPLRDRKHFKMQLDSMLLFWKKWGFKLF